MPEEARGSTKRSASDDAGRKSSRQKRSRTIEIGGFHINIDSLSDITQAEKEFLTEVVAKEPEAASDTLPKKGADKPVVAKEAKRTVKVAPARSRATTSLKESNMRMQRDTEAAKVRASHFFAMHHKLWSPFGAKLAASKKGSDKSSNKGSEKIKSKRSRKVNGKDSKGDEKKKTATTGPTKGSGKSKALLRELQKPWPPPKTYLALNNETCTVIAKKLDIDAAKLVALNQKTYPGLKLNSKFKPDTELVLPIRCPVEHYRLLPGTEAEEEGEEGEEEEEDDEEEEEEEEEEDEEEEFVVDQIVSHRGPARTREYEVLWEPCNDNNYVTHDTTWQTEEVLVEDGLKHKVDAYWENQKNLSAVGHGHHKPPVAEVKQPAALTGVELRPYQLEGLRWLVDMYDKGVSAILADEMGLGKTLQTIAFLAHLKFERNVQGPHLVVCPMSVLATWTSEFKRFCPQMRVLKLHSSNPEERSRATAELQQQCTELDVVVTTYEMVKASTTSHAFAKIWFRYVVLDEGHLIKNELTLTHKCATGLHSQGKLLLTGTPLQNNLHELWSLLHYLYPSIFPTSEKFDQGFNLNAKEPTVDTSTLLRAKQLLQPLMLRRLKSEVAL